MPGRLRDNRLSWKLDYGAVKQGTNQADNDPLMDGLSPDGAWALSFAGAQLNRKQDAWLSITVSGRTLLAFERPSGSSVPRLKWKGISFVFWGFLLTIQLWKQMRAAELSLQKYNYLLYFQIVLQVHIRRLHPDFFLFTCLLLPRAPSLLLDASLRSNNKRLLMRIQSSFADFHSLFNKPISSPCAPLTQRNYGNMTDNNAIVITTAWPSWRAACQCFMDDSDFICGKTFISVFVDCGQKLVYGPSQAPRLKVL